MIKAAEIAGPSKRASIKDLNQELLLVTESNNTLIKEEADLTGNSNDSISIPSVAAQEDIGKKPNIPEKS